MGYVILALCVLGGWQGLAIERLQRRVDYLERRFYRDPPP